MEKQLDKIRLKKPDPALKIKILLQVRERVQKDTLLDNISFIRIFWATAAAVFVLLFAANVYMNSSHESFMIKEYHTCGDMECKMEIIAMSGINSGITSPDVKDILNNFLKPRG
ncbi:MAG: hypothetical protein V1752_06930 [Candidatus Firestonebacteria bacterium]